MVMSDHKTTGPPIKNLVSGDSTTVLTRFFANSTRFYRISFSLQSRTPPTQHPIYDQLSELPELQFAKGNSTKYSIWGIRTLTVIKAPNIYLLLSPFHNVSHSSIS
jgi:hypothetical protein